MMGATLAIHDESFRVSAAQRSARKAMATKAAWAKYVRNRWPSNTVKEIMAEFGLSDGQARGLLYAQGSQSAIDACLAHKNGGPLLELDMLLVRWRMTADELAEYIDDRDANEREREEARRQSRRAAVGRLAAVRSLGPSPDEVDDLPTSTGHAAD